jgi:methylmalonyl-CoA mutase N-terminal domain/subunit
MAPKAPDSSSESEDRRFTDSGIEIRPLYGPADLEGWDPDRQLGIPGHYPFTRGIRADMYRGRLWTMRQYAGFGTAESTNERFKFLLSAGQTGLSCAFDLPTQMGYDSDHPRSEGEVGKVGVAIDSMADMRLLLAGLPLDKVTTSMTINATAAILLLFYQLVAEETGVDPKLLGGTIQNDILKEYVARGTYIYPPRPSMRLVTDTFSYCAEHLPAWNTISISGYHIREAGSTAVQEIAFTIANGIAYVEAALAAGLDVDAFAPRLSFFWNAHNNLFEEIAKYRAARRMWAKLMTERFGAKDPKSTLLRFHTQTGGSTLTAQQPENNIVRVTVQAMAAALGGTQSLHTNGFDEALGLPTQRAAKIALRTQQIVGYESGIADTVDPLAGSWFVESLTDEVEQAAWEYLERIDAMGGAVDAIEAQYMQQEIEQAAYAYAKDVDAHEKIIVGVNKFVDEELEPTDVFPIDPELQRSQVARVKRVRQERHAEPAAADEVGAGGHGHAGRGVGRAPGGVRGVPPQRLGRCPPAGQAGSAAGPPSGAPVLGIRRSLLSVVIDIL